MGDETGRIMVSRREYVTRIVSPTTPAAFSNHSYNLNPGLSGVFAWLSQIASNFDEYEFEKLVFTYQPVISAASTTGAMGSVVVACNYNAGAPKFQSFREMVEYQGAIETRVCDPIAFGIECDPAKNAGHDMEYVRSGSVPTGEDVKSYDIGTFQMATSDISPTAFPAGTLLGHVYVEYAVRLGKPKLYSALGKNIRTDLIRGTQACTAALPFGTQPMYSRESTLGGVMGASGGNSEYVFPENFEGTVVVKIFSNSSTTDDAGLSLIEYGNIVNAKCAGYTGAEYFETSSGEDAMKLYYFDVGQQKGDVLNRFLLSAEPGAGTFWGSAMLVSVVNPEVVKREVDWVPFL